MKRLISGLMLLCCSLAFGGQEGLASWYGGKFQGRRTASGEIFDTNQLTAAHRTLPFDTMVKVTNLLNGKSTIVRINDRGPFVQGRIIDLSRAAASALDMTGRGVAPVKIETVAPAKNNKRYLLQLGAFRNPENARRLMNRLREAGLKPALENGASGVVRVILPGVGQDSLSSVQERLAKLGIQAPLVRIERSGGANPGNQDSRTQ